MGGIGLVLTIIAFTLVAVDFDLDLKYLALVVLVAGFALVGFVDDLVKIVKKRNLGLTFWQKIFLQTVLAAGFSAFLINLGHHGITEPILKLLGMSNPVLYSLFSIFIVVGSANAANLTDGLDGLLAGCAGIAFLAFAFLSSRSGFPDAVTFSIAASGAILAFLFFNFPKADVFMGDVGSLPIGAALGGIAIIIHRELYLIIIGGIFVAEALSVIIQVLSYKLWKKRIFKMTPLHHHFEMKGHKEISIVFGFWVVAVVLGTVGVLM